MSQIKQIGIFILFVLCVACSKEQQKPLYIEIQDINELVVNEVRVEKTIIIDDPNISFKDIGTHSGIVSDAFDWMKGKMTVGKRIGVYSFGTYLVASIDLNQLAEQDVVYNAQTKSYTITVPPIQIKERGRDFDLKVEHERVSTFRSLLTPQEKADAKNKASRLLNAEIKKDGELQKQLTESAQLQVRAYLEALLTDWGYKVTIKFAQNHD